MKPVIVRAPASPDTGWVASPPSGIRPIPAHHPGPARRHGRRDRGGVGGHRNGFAPLAPLTVTQSRRLPSGDRPAPRHRRRTRHTLNRRSRPVGDLGGLGSTACSGSGGGVDRLHLRGLLGQLRDLRPLPLDGACDEPQLWIRSGRPRLLLFMAAPRARDNVNCSGAGCPAVPRWRAGRQGGVRET